MSELKMIKQCVNKDNTVVMYYSDNKTTVVCEITGCSDNAYKALDKIIPVSVKRKFSISEYSLDEYCKMHLVFKLNTRYRGKAVCIDEDDFILEKGLSIAFDKAYRKYMRAMKSRLKLASDCFAKASESIENYIEMRKFNVEK